MPDQTLTHQSIRVACDPQPCAAGTYTSRADLSSAAECVPSPIGSYAITGSIAPAKCSAGTFTAATGEAACESCAAGTFQLGTGATACNACLQGSYCPEGAVSRGQGSEEERLHLHEKHDPLTHSSSQPLLLSCSCTCRLQHCRASLAPSRAAPTLPAARSARFAHRAVPARREARLRVSAAPGRMQAATGTPIAQSA